MGSHRIAWRGLWGGTIAERTLATFFSNFARAIGSGVAIPSALTSAAGLNPELAEIAQSVAPRLWRGEALHNALRPYRNRLPELCLPVLEVGEVSGTLEGACERLARNFEAIDGFQRRFGDVGLDIRKIVLGAVFFKLVFSGGVSFLAVATSAAWTVGEILLVYVILRLAHRELWRLPKLHRLVDKIRLAIPHMGAIERNLATARWARSFATMWHAGVPISQALDVASRSTLNAYYESRLQEAVRLTRDGVGLPRALAGLELAPRHLLPLLEVGAQTSRFGEALDRYVSALEEEALVKSQQEAMGAMVIGYLAAMMIAVFFALGVIVPR